MKYTLPRGTRDLLPDENDVFAYLEHEFVSILRNYNYREIKTPIFESSELFERAVGEDTDIVNKEMYTFQDKGGRNITLRPEGTASVVRAYLQNNAYFQKQKLVKLYYSGPMFRYERPQAGRYRQFYQLGIEAIGSSSPFLDAEVTMMGIAMLEKVGFNDVIVSLNSVGCEVCRPVIRERVKGFVGSILPNLCEDCNSRYENNPLRLLDCKKTNCQTFFSGMPDINEAQCHTCKDHFLSVISTLEANNVEYVLDPNLVRGLDYYTRTVFEIKADVLGVHNAVIGGGRYDNLIKEFGGRHTPAFGFAIGLDRLMLVLQKSGVKVPDSESLKFFIVGLGEKEREEAFKWLHKCRNLGYKSEFYYKDGSISNALKEANKMKAEHAIIIGENEFDDKYITVKSLKNNKQVQVKDMQGLIDFQKDINT